MLKEKSWFDKQQQKKFIMTEKTLQISYFPSLLPPPKSDRHPPPPNKKNKYDKNKIINKC